MTTVRITRLALHERGFFTANVTAAGADTVRVDSSIGPWTFPHDPSLPPDARCIRSEVVPWCAALLNKRVAAWKRQEHIDEATEHPVAESQARARPVERETPVRRPVEPTPTTTDAIARRMAQAGAAAVKEAA